MLEASNRTAVPVPEGAVEVPQHGISGSSDIASVIRYASHGRLLVCAPAHLLPTLAPRLPRNLRTWLLADGQLDDPLVHELTGYPGVEYVDFGRPGRLTGHLGSFDAWLVHGENEVSLAQVRGEKAFDLVLDLHQPPLLSAQLAPPGYFPVRDDPRALDDALTELPDLIGEFEKPRYFRYQTDLCAHGRSGLTGCQRCLTACPAEAIRSIGERIEIDPNLCHGAGGCSAVCPTGAIRYVVPKPSELLTRAARSVDALTESVKVVIVHTEREAEHVRSLVARQQTVGMVTIPVEEIGLFGCDALLALLARGADYVWLIRNEQTPGVALHALRGELDTAHTLLQALGLSPEKIWLTGIDDVESALNSLPTNQDCSLPAATFAFFDDKKTMMRLATDHLYQHAPSRPAQIQLAEGAPFGTLVFNTEACTLCLSCVGNCPTKALADGVDTPRLDFIEQNCVQCGICVQACPEKAITLQSRFLFSSEQRRSRRLLKEEEPFCCIGCGKPFATKSVIARMLDKLAGHSMFQGDALNRLKMCDDCRVRAIFHDQEPGFLPGEKSRVE